MGACSGSRDQNFKLGTPVISAVVKRRAFKFYAELKTNEYCKTDM